MLRVNRGVFKKLVKLLDVLYGFFGSARFWVWLGDALASFLPERYCIKLQKKIFSCSVFFFKIDCIKLHQSNPCD